MQTSLQLDRIRWHWLVLLVAMQALGHADELVTEPPAPTVAWDWSQLDWKTLEQLSPSEKSALPIGCCGAFIQPAVDAQPVDDGHQDDIAISGTTSQITKQSTVMTGDVVLTQGQRKISGDTAELFNQPQGVTLKGNVLFREPGFLLQGSDANVNLEQNTLLIKNARYVLHDQHIHGEAGQVERDAQGVITLTDSTYSSCTPGDEVWYLRSSSMMLDPANGQGKATNVRVEVMDVPVFYFPYLQFPIGNQRHSGFLSPTLASNNNGINITLPYYLNLAPNYDATIVPSYISERGNQIGGEFRHLSPFFKSTASASWLADDKKQAGDDRWLFGVKQTGGEGQPWSTLVDVTRVSDNNYFTDLDNSNLSVSKSTDLKQRGEAGYMTDHWDTSIEVLQYQILRTSTTSDPYHKLPEVKATGNYYLGNGFTTQLFQSAANFEHNDSAQNTGDRLVGDYRLAWRNDWQAAYVEPSVELHYMEQKLNNTTGVDNPRVTIPGANLDMGLVFVRDDAEYRQTLEPHLYYNYTGYKNQNDFQLFDTDEMSFGYPQIFRGYRFSGSDRVGDANQTSLGVTSRWLDNNSGKEWVQFGMAQTFYNEDRRVTAYTPVQYAALPQNVQNAYTDNRSPIASFVQWNFRPQWRLSSELAWSEQERHTNSGNVFLHYQGATEELFSVGYRYVQLLELTGTTYTQETVEEGDISAYWPISDQWALVGRANYDFTNTRSLETLAGFQYEDCCWRLSTVYRAWAINPDDVTIVNQQASSRGIYFEIQFKNLAGVGTKTNSMLKNSVYGYDQDKK